MKLFIGKAVLEVTVVDAVSSKTGKTYKQVLMNDVKIGNLFMRTKAHVGWNEATQDISFVGDIYIEGGTQGLKAGDIHPETQLKVKESPKADGTGTYLELDGVQGAVAKAFYKAETGTVTLNVVLK